MVEPQLPRGLALGSLGFNGRTMWSYARGSTTLRSPVEAILRSTDGGRTWTAVTGPRG